jgi:twitching motility protein PilT
VEQTITSLLRSVTRATDGFYSDVQAREQDCLRVRTTAGLEPMRDTMIGRRDILEFIERVQPGVRFEDELARNGGECNFSFELEGEPFRGNLARYNGSGWYALALRKLDRQVRTLEELGLPGTLRDWLLPDSGLVLVAGPTGSGKSSTLASFVEQLNRTRSIHIVTIEDPIEYRYEQKLATITQRQVGQDTSDFASAARNALRQDPDVIVIGEVRDLAAAREAIRLGETGHLVLASLHADSAVGAIDRLAKLFDGSNDRQLLMHGLAAQLIGVLYQKLVVTTRTNGVGLPLRVPLYEVLTNTAAMANLIRDGRVIEIPTAIQLAGAAAGQVEIEHVIEDLRRRGVIDKQVAQSSLRARHRLDDQPESGGGHHA